MRKTKNDLG